MNFKIISFFLSYGPDCASHCLVWRTHTNSSSLTCRFVGKALHVILHSDMIRLYTFCIAQWWHEPLYLICSKNENNSQSEVVPYKLEVVVRSDVILQGWVHMQNPFIFLSTSQDHLFWMLYLFSFYLLSSSSHLQRLTTRQGHLPPSKLEACQECDGRTGCRTLRPAHLRGRDRFLILTIILTRRIPSARVTENHTLRGCHGDVNFSSSNGDVPK